MLPEWARKTLEPNLALSESLSLECLETAQSPDPVWNATQNELLRAGMILNYVRMIWGKGIVRWRKIPRKPLSRMEYLNNKYALDGRDVNSYTGFLWCLGKCDRPWPPGRPPFGLVRVLSSKTKRKKREMKQYLSRFG